MSRPGNILLSRDQFRELTFERDKHTCVFCDKPAQDAHHIIERRLWSDGGYYLDNGCFDEMNFWLKVFQGFHFAKDHARGWWWIAIVPNHRTGFASKIGGYEDRSYPERDKREVTFVFQDETDAILTSSYMDTIEPITVTL